MRWRDPFRLGLTGGLLAVRLVPVLWAVDVELRDGGVRAAVTTARRRADRTPTWLLSDAERVALAVAAAARLVRRATCLRRAIVLSSMLDRGGWTAEVVLGVARRGSMTYDFHAWVEVDARPLGEPDDPRHRFGRLAGLPGVGAG